jgi:hypothetical protein
MKHHFLYIKNIMCILGCRFIPGVAIAVFDSAEATERHSWIFHPPIRGEDLKLCIFNIRFCYDRPNITVALIGRQKN